MNCARLILPLYFVYALSSCSKPQQIALNETWDVRLIECSLMERDFPQSGNYQKAEYRRSTNTESNFVGIALQMTNRSSKREMIMATSLQFKDVDSGKVLFAEVMRFKPKKDYSFEIPEWLHGGMAPVAFELNPGATGVLQLILHSPVQRGNAPTQVAGLLDIEPFDVAPKGK